MKQEFPPDSHSSPSIPHNEVYYFFFVILTCHANTCHPSYLVQALSPQMSSSSNLSTHLYRLRMHKQAQTLQFLSDARTAGCPLNDSLAA